MTVCLFIEGRQYFVEKSEEYTKSFLELINGFSRNAGCSQHEKKKKKKKLHFLIFFSKE